MVDRIDGDTFFRKVDIVYQFGSQKLQDYEIFAKHLNKTDDKTGQPELNMAVQFVLKRYSNPFILKYHLPCGCIVIACGSQRS
jgi:hypothetical protein